MTENVNDIAEFKYERPSYVKIAIAESYKLTFEELCERAGVLNRRSPQYVLSEVVLNRLRETKHDNNDDRFMKLYDVLKRRVMHAAPRPEHRRGGKDSEDVRLAEMRDKLVEHVMDMVLVDRHSNCTKLDFYECKFDYALRLAKIDRFRDSGRKNDLNVPLDYGDGTGDFAREVDETLQRLKGGLGETNDEHLYRIDVRRAIDSLPDKEREVIDMLLADIPKEASNLDQRSISSILGCTPKTVHNRAVSGIRRLREQFGEGEKL